MDADRLIETLGLVPHPEGGHYAETYRAPASGTARSAVTAIYFLLRAGERSHWHRIDATEIWHYQAGEPLQLEIADDGGTHRHRLGPNVLSGDVGHAVVPPGRWQAAAPLGAWTLVSCTVAPGFAFEGFELAPPGWSPPGAVG
ncbi:MAG: cupin domain-containing protein [Pseudomonadota bacterium]